MGQKESAKMESMPSGTSQLGITNTTKTMNWSQPEQGATNGDIEQKDR